MLEGEACEQEGCSAALPFSRQTPGRLLSRAALGVLSNSDVHLGGWVLPSQPSSLVCPSQTGLEESLLKVDCGWKKVMGLTDQCMPEFTPPRAAIQPPSFFQKYNGHFCTLTHFGDWFLHGHWRMGCFLCQIYYHS